MTRSGQRRFFASRAAHASRVMASGSTSDTYVGTPAGTPPGRQKVRVPHAARDASRAKQLKNNVLVGSGTPGTPGTPKNGLVRGGAC